MKCNILLLPKFKPFPRFRNFSIPGLFIFLILEKSKICLYYFLILKFNYFIIHFNETFYRGKQKYQHHSYNDSYQKHLDQYSWFLFIDVDEYLFIKNNASIFDFLEVKKFKNCDSIVINYMEFGDSDLLNYDGRPLSERFTKRSRFCFSMKSFVKGGIKNATIDIHRPINIRYHCNSKGEIIVPTSYFTHNLSIENAVIRH